MINRNQLKCLLYMRRINLKVLKYHYNLEKKKKSVKESSKVSSFRAQVGQLGSMGTIQLSTCFHMAQKLRKVFTLLSGGEKNQKKNIF